MEDVHPPSVDRICIINMVLTAIPEEYAIEKNGNRGWTRELWEDNVRVPIAEFAKESKIPSNVKKKMQEESPGILAGKTIMPLDLEKITSIVTKMSLKPRHEVKRMYWTKKQAQRAKENAERAGEDPPDYFPREHGIKAISNWGKDRIRHELEGLEDLLIIVDYTGETEQREDFTPGDVEITSL